MTIFECCALLSGEGGFPTLCSAVATRLFVLNRRISRLPNTKSDCRRRGLLILGSRLDPGNPRRVLEASEGALAPATWEPVMPSSSPETGALKSQADLCRSSPRRRRLLYTVKCMFRRDFTLLSVSRWIGVAVCKAGAVGAVAVGVAPFSWVWTPVGIVVALLLMLLGSALSTGTEGRPPNHETAQLLYSHDPKVYNPIAVYQRQKPPPNTWAE